VVFLILSAPVLFAIQLIVYAGAIMVLFLFVIMFFMSPEARTWRQRTLKRQYVVGGTLALAFIMLIAWGMLRTDADEAFSTQWSLAAPPTGSASLAQQEAAMGQPRAIGQWLFANDVLPFELTSLLLLLAILGAMLVARDVHSEGREKLPEFAPVYHDDVNSASGAPVTKSAPEGKEVPA
jgi:NADH-quinone oxidoreductase subunit J